MYESSITQRHISILDGGADTCVLGKGWDILSIHNSRREMLLSLIMRLQSRKIFQLLVQLLL